MSLITKKCAFIPYSWDIIISNATTNQIQKFCACIEFKISYFYINLSQPSFGQMNQQMQKNVKNSLITEVIVQIK
ncbi:hypothetical protein T09_13953 [Trichinella sp. T9]|nr:hypothetical protein T09_13953 [Trichinella sp. T9]